MREREEDHPINHFNDRALLQSRPFFLCCSSDAHQWAQSSPKGDSRRVFGLRSHRRIFVHRYDFSFIALAWVITKKSNYFRCARISCKYIFSTSQTSRSCLSMVEVRKQNVREWFIQSYWKLCAVVVYSTVESRIYQVCTHKLLCVQILYNTLWAVFEKSFIYLIYFSHLSQPVAWIESTFPYTHLHTIHMILRQNKQKLSFILSLKTVHAKLSVLFHYIRMSDHRGIKLAFWCESSKVNQHGSICLGCCVF